MGGSASVPETPKVLETQAKKPCEGDACPIVEKPKLKPCCACPETKKARDAWYLYFFVILYEKV